MSESPELVFVRTSRRGWVFMRIDDGRFRKITKRPKDDIRARAIRTDREAWELVSSHEEEIRRYARVLARKLRPATMEEAMKDACGEAKLGAFRAAQLYDPSFGTKFMTMAKYWIRLHVQRHLIGRPGEKKWAQPKVIHIDEQGDEYDILPPSVVDFDDIVFRNEARRLLQQALGRLPAIQRKVIRYRVQGKTFRYIGRSLGVSFEYARQIEAKALGSLAAAVRQGVSAAAPA